MIVGVLAALAFPSYTNYMLRGKRAEGRVILMDAASKMEKHYGDCFAVGTTIAVEGIVLLVKWISVVLTLLREAQWLAALAQHSCMT